MIKKLIHRIILVLFLFNNQHAFTQESKSIIHLDNMVNDQNISRYLVINTADSLLKYTKNQESLHLIYYIKGLAYEDLGLYSYSQKYYQESMAIALKTDDEKMKTKSYLGLGNMYLHREMLNEAGIYYRNLLKLSEKTGKPKSLIIAYSSMAIYLKNIGSIDSSFYYIRKTVDLVKNKYKSKEDNSYYLQINYNTLSKLFLVTNQADSALFYARAALALFDQTHLIDGKISSLSTIAQAYQLYGNYQFAEIMLLEEIGLIEKLGIEDKFVDGYDLLSKLYERKGNFKQALEYSRIYQNKKHRIDSLGSESRLFEMNRIFENNNLVLTQEKLNAVNANLKRRNLTYFSVFICSLLVIIVLIIIIKKRKNEILTKNKIMILEQKRFEKESEIKELERHLLEKKIEWKNKNISDTAIISSRKTELILKTSSKLKELSKMTDLDSIKVGLNEEISYLKDQLVIDKGNLALQNKVLENSEDFYDKLKEMFPTLTKSDLELCGLIKLNLSIKEIATTRNNTFETIKTARFRIRKKLNINNPDISTSDFLNSI